MGWTPHGQAGLHAGALLWDGGRRRALEAAAALGVDASRAAAEARALATEGSVTRLFLGLSEGRALEVAALGRLSAVDGAIEAARARLEAGSGLASEVESLEARRAALDEALLVVCSKQAEQLASLGILAGAGALEVDLDAPLGDWDQDGAALLTLPELFDQARATRPDLVALSAAVDARRESLFASELASGPTLVAFADAWLDGGTPLGAVDRGSASVGAQLNWSLLDGGLRASHEAGARADLRASRAALAEATQALELELGSARRAVELADLRTVTASRGAASARRALTELDAGYEAGQVSLERWLGAESDAGEAETRVQAARVRATLARANLTLTLGQSLLAPTTLTPEPPSR